MPRRKRFLSSSKVYHIIIKGIDESDIFFSDQDRINFIEKLKLVKEKFFLQIYAYCLMSNHVHLVFKADDEFLSKSIQNLSQRYSYYFNSIYNRKGPLFQDRFFSKNVENQKYFLDVCRYVHRNPEKAQIALTTEYKWSSYQEYIESEKIISKEILLYYFSNDLNNFIKFTTREDTLVDLISSVNFEMNTRIPDEEIVEIIIKICNIENVSEIFEYFKIKENREALKEFKEIREVSISQLSRITRVNKKALGQILDRDR